MECTDLDGNDYTDDEDYIGGGITVIDTTVGTNTGSGDSSNGNPGASGKGSSNGGGNTTGYSQAPEVGTPGSQYTQVSSDGQNRTVSVTTYNEYGQRGTRVDYSGRDHRVGLPHIHIYSYGIIEGHLRRTKEIIKVYLDE